MHSLNVPHQFQDEPSWCLPACIAMVSAYWGIPVLQADVARWLGTSEIGTPSSRVQRLTSQKYSIIYSEGSIATLTEWLERSCPLIIFVHTGDLPYWTIDTAHAVVVVGLEAGNITLLDPAMDAEYHLVPLNDLLLAWSSSDYTFTVIQPQR